MPPQNERLDPALTKSGSSSTIADSTEDSKELSRAPRQVAASLGLSPSRVDAGVATLRSVRQDLPNNSIFNHELVPEDQRLSLTGAAYLKKPSTVILQIGGGGGEPGHSPPALDASPFSESSSLLDVPREESWCTFLAQVFPSFMLAGAGMVVAGLLLDIVQSWRVFIEVSQLFVLVPALLGLKGNLEMTLASRLSTKANLGKTESMADVCKLACGNMALLQCQSVVVGALASLYAIVTSLVVSEEVSLRHGVLVVSSSIITASAASLLLGGIMISVVVSSKCCRVNPDNVSIPIAAALGDVITLGLLAFVSAAIFKFLDALPWLSLLVSGPLVLLLPVWAYVAYKNEDTRDVLSCGWPPIICAMLISSLSGNILDVAIKKFTSMAAFQPLMNGVGGNLAAVQASRMSTLLHRQKCHQEKSVQASPIDGCSSTSLSDSTGWRLFDARAAAGSCSVSVRRRSRAATARRAVTTPSRDGECTLRDGAIGSSVPHYASTIFQEPDCGASSRSGYVLLALVVPGHLVFMNLVSLAKSGTPVTSASFIVLFCASALVQMILLLLATRVIVRALWRNKIDPDSTAIPYVTSLGDLLGTGLLAFVFWIMSLLGTKI